MAEYRTRDGRVLKWTGQNICVCSHCDEIFNSVGAFDAHIKAKGKGGERTHDHSWMPRNSRGYKVTSLREPEEVA